MRKYRRHFILDNYRGYDVYVVHFFYKDYVDG